MKGATRSRNGSHALRRRCPVCKHLRKFYEPDGNHGGECHRDRMPRTHGTWMRIDGVWVCGKPKCEAKRLERCGDLHGEDRASREESGMSLLEEPTGDCEACGVRPATCWWIGDGGTYAIVRGHASAWCEPCVVEGQIEDAEKAAARLPELYAKRAALRLVEMDAVALAVSIRAWASADGVAAPVTSLGAELPKLSHGALRMLLGAFQATFERGRAAERDLQRAVGDAAQAKELERYLAGGGPIDGGQE